MYRSKVFVHGFLLIATCVVAIGCESSGQGPTFNTSVSGVVTDSLTGDPIATAAIYFDDTLALTLPRFTDSLGRWTGAFPGSGPEIYFCKAPGYATKQLHLHSTYLKHDFMNVDFELVPAD